MFLFYCQQNSLRERTVAEAVGDGDGGLGADLQRLGRGAGSKGAACRQSSGPGEAAALAEGGSEEGRGPRGRCGGAGGGAEEDSHG